ncbi:hypothetical protein ACQKWADRAFT_172640 [Trichoderma austrokoningii]
MVHQVCLAFNKCPNVPQCLAKTASQFCCLRLRTHMASLLIKSMSSQDIQRIEDKRRCITRINATRAQAWLRFSSIFSFYFYFYFFGPRDDVSPLLFCRKDQRTIPEAATKAHLCGVCFSRKLGYTLTARAANIDAKTVIARRPKGGWSRKRDKAIAANPWRWDMHSRIMRRTSAWGLPDNNLASIVARHSPLALSNSLFPDTLVCIFLHRPSSPQRTKCYPSSQTLELAATPESTMYRHISGMTPEPCTSHPLRLSTSHGTARSPIAKMVCRRLVTLTDRQMAYLSKEYAYASLLYCLS